MTRYIDRAARGAAERQNREVTVVTPETVAGLIDKHYPSVEEIRAHGVAAERLVAQFGEGAVLKVIDAAGLYWGCWRLGRNWCREAVAVVEVGQ
jgi:hypothetical protein